MNGPLEIAIIGGGITGLAAAHHIESAAGGRPVQVSLFEANGRLGGKISTVHHQGMVLELGAESFLSRKVHGIQLCKALGIADQLRGTRPENRRTFVWKQNRMHPLPEGLSGLVPGNAMAILQSDLLSLRGRIRVAADLVIPAGRHAGDESIASFVSRRFGREAFEKLVEPLLCGIYGGRGETLSLEATFPELRELEKQSGSLIRGLKKRSSGTVAGTTLPPFVTFAGGMGDLIEAIRSSLQTTSVLPNCRIRSVARISNRFRIEVESGGVSTEREFDAVINTAPAHAAAEMIEDLDADLAAWLRSIPFVSTAAVNLWYGEDDFQHPLNGYGFVIPMKEQRGATAMTWTSSKHFDRVPPGIKLVRVFLGRAGAEVDPGCSDDELSQVAVREIERTMGIRATPMGFAAHRWVMGSPQYTLGHVQRVEKIDSLLKHHPGMYLAGASYRGVGIPDCIRDATRAVDRLFADIAERSS